MNLKPIRHVIDYSLNDEIIDKDEFINFLFLFLSSNKLLFSKQIVVGVSGGIDSAVVSTLCARTGLPTYVLTMPLDSNKNNTELSDAHAEFLKSKYW